MSKVSVSIAQVVRLGVVSDVVIVMIGGLMFALRADDKAQAIKVAASTARELGIAVMSDDLAIAEES